jgi:voltage-gated potassium channel
MTVQLLRRFIWCSIALLTIVLIGTIGYWLIGGGQASVMDALYMTFITISTIGFTEVINLTNNPAGRVFTMFIAVSGIGVMAYAVTNLTALIVEGQLTTSLKRRHMENTAKKLQGHYIVCGIGTLGQHIIDELRTTKREVVTIEMDRSRIEKALEVYKDGTFIEGDATANDILTKAGIDRARGVFAVTGDDNLNLVISLSAKQLNPSVRVVVECTDVKNSDKMKKAGADAVISPSYIGGLRMASEMIRPTVVSFLDIMLRDRDNNLRVEEIPVPGDFASKTVAELGIKKYPHSLLLAIRTGSDWIYNPPDKYVVSPGVNLVFMTTPEGRQTLEKMFK